MSPFVMFTIPSYASSPCMGRIGVPEMAQKWTYLRSELRPVEWWWTSSLYLISEPDFCQCNWQPKITLLIQSKRSGCNLPWQISALLSSINAWSWTERWMDESEDAWNSSRTRPMTDRTPSGDRQDNTGNWAEIQINFDLTYCQNEPK